MASPKADISINENSGIPIWLQLRNRLVYLISQGYYKPGDQLPTVRELAVKLGINYNTVNKVYQDIERNGYILSKRGRGTFVADSERLSNLEAGHDLDVFFDEFIRSCDELGIIRNDILAHIQSRLENSEKQ